MPSSRDIRPQTNPILLNDEARQGPSPSSRQSSRAKRSRRSAASSALTPVKKSCPTPLFAGISQLVSVAFNVRSGEEIFGESEDAQFVYKIVTGSVRVCKMLNDGRRHISCFHVPGDVFGLERMTTHRMGAGAIEDSHVLMFRRSHVERLIAPDLDAADQMLRIFVSKLDDAEAQCFG